ncbi:MAG: gephyrin-like molybdotransferase Glp [Syntrophobacteraceae bacterium]
MASEEIDHGAQYCGYADALALIYSHCSPVGVELIPLAMGIGRIVAEDLVAVVSSPSTDISLKDGFAVRSEDLVEASLENPVRLRVIGSVTAGSRFEGVVSANAAVKVCSGSPIPSGADAVVADEFCKQTPSEVYARADAQAGRNLQRAGEDVTAGTIIVQKARTLLPGRLGLLAAAGVNRIKVFRRPKVAVMAIGDELVALGKPLQPGQLYASNLVTIGGWLDTFGITYETALVPDSRQAIGQKLLEFLPHVDAILTAGGAWNSERDLIVRVLEDLGWSRLFHHVRMGPGKGIAFGSLERKLVFCLPGGPTSNGMALLQLALPGILRMAGQSGMPFRTVLAELRQDVKGRHKAWTEFKEAELIRDSKGNHSVTTHKTRSRLQAIADTTCLVCIPEGIESLRFGDIVPVQILVP